MKVLLIVSVVIRHITFLQTLLLNQVVWTFMLQLRGKMFLVVMEDLMLLEFVNFVITEGTLKGSAL